MRCYFLTGGHIVSVEDLAGLSDGKAIARAQALFLEREIPAGAFEVWDQARVIIGHPTHAQEPTGAGGGPAAMEGEASWHIVLMPSQ